MKRIAMGVASIAMTAGATMGMTAPAQAQVNVGNLVNVNISNVLNNNQVTVAVPINAAANICGVDVTALAVVEEGGTFTDCRARGHQDVTVSPTLD